MRQYAQLIIKMNTVELPKLGHPVLLGQNPENGTFSIEKFLLLGHLTHKRRVAVQSVQIGHFDFQFLDKTCRESRPRRRTNQRLL